MKFKVFFILSGVIILHAVILTGVCLTGGCNSTPVLGPRPYIPAPADKQEEIIPDTGIDKGIPPVSIKSTTITLPSAPPSAPTFKMADQPEGLVYTVKKNDSFWKIARKHGVTMQSLAAYNNMPLNKVLKVGEKLKIPPGGYIAKDVKPVRPAKKTAKAPSGVKPQARPADGVYVIKSGDSFWKIAKKYNIKTKTLLEANNMTGKEVLQIGQKLVIPDGKKSAPDTVTAAKSDTSVKSILDTVESPTNIDSGKSAVAPAKTAAPKEIKELINDSDIDSSASDRAVQVLKDIKVEDFAKRHKVTPAMLKKLNDDYPADGVFKEGSVVIIRSSE
ncbi:MAG: LysM peptidoglycan-binding domain-containing protein [Victivallaceae bacterium]